MFRFTESQSKYIKNLYNNDQFSDVDIKITNGVIHSHKFLLCISSEYARSMFTGVSSSMREGQNNVIDLTGYDPVHVSLCIKSLYDDVSNDVNNLIHDNPEQYGFLLDLVSYLGIHKLQLIMESIGANKFNSIWKFRIRLRL